MAIDNQEKRMSAATAGRIWMRATFPSGTIDEEERVSTGAAYSGNALPPPAFIPFCPRPLARPDVCNVDDTSPQRPDESESFPVRSPDCTDQR